MALWFDVKASFKTGFKYSKKPASVVSKEWVNLLLNKD
jgi:hypothetical protein